MFKYMFTVIELNNCILEEQKFDVIKQFADY